MTKLRVLQTTGKRFGGGLSLDSTKTPSGRFIRAVNYRAFGQENTSILWRGNGAIPSAPGVKAFPATISSSRCTLQTVHIIGDDSQGQVHRLLGPAARKGINVRRVVYYLQGYDLVTDTYTFGCYIDFDVPVTFTGNVSNEIARAAAPQDRFTIFDRLGNATASVGNRHSTAPLPPYFYGSSLLLILASPDGVGRALEAAKLVTDHDCHIWYAVGHTFCNVFAQTIAVQGEPGSLAELQATMAEPSFSARFSPTFVEISGHPRGSQDSFDMFEFVCDYNPEVSLLHILYLAMQETRLEMPFEEVFPAPHTGTPTSRVIFGLSKTFGGVDKLRWMWRNHPRLRSLSAPPTLKSHQEQSAFYVPAIDPFSEFTSIRWGRS